MTNAIQLFKFIFHQMHPAAILKTGRRRGKYLVFFQTITGPDSNCGSNRRKQRLLDSVVFASLSMVGKISGGKGRSFTGNK